MAAYCFTLLAARSHLCEWVENKGLLSASGIEAEGLVHHHPRCLAPSRAWTRMPPVPVKQHLGHLSHVAAQRELDGITEYRITKYSQMEKSVCIPLVQLRLSFAFTNTKMKEKNVLSHFVLGFFLEDNYLKCTVP